MASLLVPGIWLWLVLLCGAAWPLWGSLSWDFTWRQRLSELGCFTQGCFCVQRNLDGRHQATCYRRCVSNNVGVACLLFVAKPELWFAYVKKVQKPGLFWNGPKLRAKSWPPLGVTKFHQQASSYEWRLLFNSFFLSQKNQWKNSFSSPTRWLSLKFRNHFLRLLNTTLIWVVQLAIGSSMTGKCRIFATSYFMLY